MKLIASITSRQFFYVGNYIVWKNKSKYPDKIADYIVGSIVI